MSRTTKRNEWRDPRPNELDTPEFNAVRDCIKGWDIATGLDKDDFGNDLYCGATGNHVVAILDALVDIRKCRNCKGTIGIYTCSCDSAEPESPEPKER